jgi:aspartate 1-decarboxylase
MELRTLVGAKIHGIRVTDKHVQYRGSVTIGHELLTAAGIAVYEQVHVVNLANGNRWITYAIPGPKGTMSLNGGGARLGEVGDQLVVMTFVQTDRPRRARLVFCDETNEPAGVDSYPEAPFPTDADEIPAAMPLTTTDCF